MNNETCKLLMTPEQIADGEKKLAIAKRKRLLEKALRKVMTRKKAMTILSKIY